MRYLILLLVLLEVGVLLEHVQRNLRVGGVLQADLLTASHYRICRSYKCDARGPLPHGPENILCSTLDYMSVPGRQGLTMGFSHALYVGCRQQQDCCGGSDRHKKHLMGDLVASLNKIQALRHRHVSQAFQAALGFPATFGDLGTWHHIWPPMMHSHVDASGHESPLQWSPSICAGEACSKATHLLHEVLDEQGCALLQDSLRNHRTHACQDAACMRETLLCSRASISYQHALETHQGNVHTNSVLSAHDGLLPAEGSHSLLQI